MSPLLTFWQGLLRGLNMVPLTFWWFDAWRFSAMSKLIIKKPLKAKFFTNDKCTNLQYIQLVLGGFRVIIWKYLIIRMLCIRIAFYSFVKSCYLCFYIPSYWPQYNRYGVLNFHKLLKIKNIFHCGRAWAQLALKPFILDPKNFSTTLKLPLNPQLACEGEQRYQKWSLRLNSRVHDQRNSK